MGARQRKVETFFWGQPPSDPAERRLLFKIDCFVLSYVCLSYFVNYLDRANLANAYVTGMKEDIGFVGNAYTYAGSMFTAGYILGQWPSALILSSGRVRPRVWFPFCIFVWGFLTLALACEFCLPLRVGKEREMTGTPDSSLFDGCRYFRCQDVSTSMGDSIHPGVL